MISAAVTSAWAKFDRDTGDWLSLVRHSEDAAGVARLLWDEWLPRSTKSFLATSDDEGRALAMFLAGTHDVGKLSPAFAMQVDSLCDRMRQAGLIFPKASKSSDAPHAAVSYVAIEAYFADLGADGKVSCSYASIGGGHHGVAPNLDRVGLRTVARYSDLYGENEWITARRELINHIVDAAHARKFLESRWLTRPLTVPQQVLWTGFVITADWIASNGNYFPLSEFGGQEARIEDGWASLDLPMPWLADPPASLQQLMASRFEMPTGATPNAMQMAVVEQAQGMTEPGLIIVEATMGSGKTEAALAAAEHLAAQFGFGGLIVALPTMATSNAMFSRVKHWLEGQPSDDISSLMLAHGKSHLNDDFANQPRRRSFQCIGEDEAPKEENQKSEVIAHQWFFGRKRSLLSNFVVGTIDQVLFAGLKAKHVALRHLAIAGKIVIIDEVHAADDYMRHYLVRVLEWLAAYRIPVIMLSATLPSSQRIELAQAYERGRGIEDPTGDSIDGNIGYPVVTSVSSARVTRVVDSLADTAVMLDRIGDSDSELLAYLDGFLGDGGCVAVVRNTVRRAQDTARALREVYGADVVLLHSRFMACHRAKLEAGIVAKLGRARERPHRRIVVATQVIEQSLDVDFDLMVTDLAPIDLVLQRAGRLHRHQRDSRPAPMRKPRLALSGVDNWNTAPPTPVAENAVVYQLSRLLRAAAVLYGKCAISIPSDLPLLVQSAYSDDFAVPPGWSDAMAEADNKYANVIADQKRRASQWRLSGPTEKRDLIDWLNVNVGDADDPRGYAKVRDSDEGIEVLLTERDGGAVYLLPQCESRVIDTEFDPSADLARTALTSSVALPRKLCHGMRGEESIKDLESRMYPGWQGSRWLAGELVVELDENRRAYVGDSMVEYHDQEGFSIVPEDSQ